MNFIVKGYCRVFQKAMKYGMYVMPWRTPEILEGEDALVQMAEKMRQKNYHRVLVVTDQGLAQIGLYRRVTDVLESAGVPYVLYTKTIPNPTIANVEEALSMYKEGGCDAIVAIGGGSAIDCGKVVGARAVKPNQSVEKMKGILRIHRKTPDFYAVPTTAGTGSETTLAAVITNQKTRHKYPINDFALIPDYAVLDPGLTVNLPRKITSTTGMDVLTHAVEAYIGGSNTKKTKEQALCAVRLVFDYLYRAYENGRDMEAREFMQEASFQAGAAFTRAYVGNVHAMAHALGGAYRVPHGLANAVILPYVLEYYGKTVYRKLARLSEAAGVALEEESDEAKAKAFIAAIRELNKRMEIPEKISGIRRKDIPVLAVWASQEANPLYPVPVIFGRRDFRELYSRIMEEEHEPDN
ncbi:MAG: iron-containing alcohol dehydrogenase [Eubacteriales bacterium]|nr:iron-containing alcohol dehydrogenase [Eubacteriales bacterium]